ncbi:MAG: PAS domain-containing protein [Deltaproteobacteria bacterium]|nr:PAS domain-containing protein [Deltaproteobacteria bacterium]
MPNQEPAVGESAVADDTLVDRLKWTTLARVLVITGVLAFAVAVDLGMAPQKAAAAPETLLYQLAAVAYGVSFVLLLLAQIGQNHNRFLVRLTWTSVLLDEVLALVLVHATGGMQSLFLFGLPLAVLNAAILLNRLGSLLAASVVAAGMVAMSLDEIGWLALPRLRVAYLSALPVVKSPTPFEIASNLALQVAAAYATAVLTSHLVRELERARRRAQQQRSELASLRVHYEDVVTSLPDGLITVGPNGLVTAANPAAEMILRMDRQQLLGRPLAATVPDIEQALAGPPGEWELARPEPQSIHSTQQIARKSAGGKPQMLAVRVAPLRDPGGKWGRVLVLRDVTDVRAREEEHRARERLAAVGSLASAVAHEIRNPLASISGAVQMLQGAGRLDESERLLMGIVVRETGQLSEWIGEFLDFARPRPLQFGEVNLYSLACETVQACLQSPSVQATGVQLMPPATPDGPGERWTLIGDAALVRQVLWNLLINATHAVQEVEQRQVAVSLRSEGDWLELAVDDSGPGIDPADSERIFEPFYTTKGSQGTGLGLATVARHVKAHAGRVRVERSPSLGGARFVVEFPRRPPGALFGDRRHSQIHRVSDAKAGLPATQATGDMGAELAKSPEVAAAAQEESP